MDTRRLTIGLSLLEIVTALSYPAIYSLPFRTFGSMGYWAAVSLATHALALLFLLVPILGLAGAVRGSRIAFLALGLWPVIAFSFGVIPLPFGHFLYTNDPAINTVIIGVVDVLALAAAIWLFLAGRPRSNSTVETDARKSDARGSP